MRLRTIKRVVVGVTTIVLGALAASGLGLLPSVTVKLPEPALTKPNIDHDKSSIFSEKRGLINFVGDIFNEDPNRAQRLNRMAEDKILAAADASELKSNAKGHISKMLVQLLSSLGFNSADVVFG